VTGRVEQFGPPRNLGIVPSMHIIFALEQPKSTEASSRDQSSGAYGDHGVESLISGGVGSSYRQPVHPVCCTDPSNLSAFTLLTHRGCWHSPLRMKTTCQLHHARQIDDTCVPGGGRRPSTALPLGRRFIHRFFTHPTWQRLVRATLDRSSRLSTQAASMLRERKPRRIRERGTPWCDPGYPESLRSR